MHKTNNSIQKIWKSCQIIAIIFLSAFIMCFALDQVILFTTPDYTNPETLGIIIHIALIPYSVFLLSKTHYILLLSSVFSYLNFTCSVHHEQPLPIPAPHSHKSPVIRVTQQTSKRMRTLGTHIVCLVV